MVRVMLSTENFWNFPPKECYFSLFPYFVFFLKRHFELFGFSRKYKTIVGGMPLWYICNNTIVKYITWKNKEDQIIGDCKSIRYDRSRLKYELGWEKTRNKTEPLCSDRGLKTHSQGFLPLKKSSKYLNKFAQKYKYMYI